MQIDEKILPLWGRVKRQRTINVITPGVGFEPTRPVRGIGFLVLTPGRPTTRLWDPGLTNCLEIEMMYLYLNKNK